MSRRYRTWSLAGALILGTAGGCKLEEPFARTNAFDSGGEVELRVEGPDSTHAINQRFTMRLVSDSHELPDDLFFLWDSDQPNMVVGGAAGEFNVIFATTTYQRVRVFAVLGDRTIAKDVYVGIRTP